jgi:cell division septum initiation protein DivIVA
MPGSIELAPPARSPEMTATAPDTERLRELEADTRQAWSAYSDRLRELTGDEYERVESESWMELQAELQRLEHEREELMAGAA